MCYNSVIMHLEALQVAVGYGRREVLHDVCLTLGSREFVGLIGPNGSGKSTLLRALSRALPPTRGVIHLDGSDIRRYKSLELARKIAFVPQQETAAFDFSVRDVVCMGRHPYHTRWGGETQEDETHVQWALREADILPLADRPVTTLSGGEYRRVLLARALAQKTPLLLLDEPTTHLDITHQVQLMALVRRLARESGLGALAALHDLNQAAEFCDRLILLRDGRVLAEGEAEMVLTPKNIQNAYGVEARIGRNPETGRPTIFAIVI